MTYVAVKAQLVTHALASGNTLNPVLIDVQDAAPVPKGQRCVRVHWAGEVDPPHMGGNSTLTSTMIGSITRVILFDPVSTTDETLTSLTDAEVKAFAIDFRTRVEADHDLGGACTDLEIGYAQSDFAVIDNVRYRVVAWDIATGYEEFTKSA